VFVIFAVHVIFASVQLWNRKHVHSCLHECIVHTLTLVLLCSSKRGGQANFVQIQFATKNGRTYLLELGASTQPTVECQLPTLQRDLNCGAIHCDLPKCQCICLTTASRPRKSKPLHIVLICKHHCKASTCLSNVPDFRAVLKSITCQLKACPNKGGCVQCIR